MFSSQNINIMYGNSAPNFPNLQYYVCNGHLGFGTQPPCFHTVHKILYLDMYMLRVCNYFNISCTMGLHLYWVELRNPY